MVERGFYLLSLPDTDNSTSDTRIESISTPADSAVNFSFVNHQLRSLSTKTSIPHDFLPPTGTISFTPHTNGVPISSTPRQRGSNDSAASSFDLGAWDDHNDDDNNNEADGDMPSDLRPPLHRPSDGRSHTPLLSPTLSLNGGEHAREQSSDRIPPMTRPTPPRRKSTLHERDPSDGGAAATRQRYTYAAFFLVLSLISFTVQTETAVYIQHTLHWNKAYCML